MKMPHSFKTKMFVMLFLSFAILSIVIFGICYGYSSKEKNKQSEKYFIEKANNTAEQLDLVISKMDAVSSQLLASQTLQQMFVEAGTKEYKDKNYFEYNIAERKAAQDVLWTFNSPKKQIDSINIFSETTYVGLRYSPKVGVIQEIASLPDWKVEEEEKYKVLPCHIDQWEPLEETQVISLVRPFIATGYNFLDVGTIEVQEKYSTIEEICSSSDSKEELQIIVLGDQQEVMYSTVELEKAKIVDINKSISQHGDHKLFEARLDSGNQMAVYSKMENVNWKVVLMQPKEIYVQSTREFFRLIVLLCLGITAVIFFLLIIITNNLTKPVLQLAWDMDKLSLSDENPQLHKCNIKEIHILQTAFSRLMERLQDSSAQLLIANETELNLRIIGLQAQISPHFLFNSLTAISAVATEENSKKVPIMCYQLSDLFRYTSSEETNQITLLDELQNVEVYFEFMKWRYEDNFNFEIHKTGKLDQVKLVRLVLQPLAENSFLHGFKSTYPPYRIKVWCNSSERGWSFTMADSGGGFEEKSLQKLNTEIDEIDKIFLSKQGYSRLRSKDKAILNLYIRLKLQYKNTLSLVITKDSELKGARITIAVVYC